MSLTTYKLKHLTFYLSTLSMFLILITSSKNTNVSLAGMILYLITYMIGREGIK